LAPGFDAAGFDAVESAGVVAARAGSSRSISSAAQAAAPSRGIVPSVVGEGRLLAPAKRNFLC
jgi:hypothetical protein